MRLGMTSTEIFQNLRRYFDTSDLRLVPGIGAKKEQELIDLGYDSLESLKNADPDELYFETCVKQGRQLDNSNFPHAKEP